MSKSIEWNTIWEEEAHSIPNTATQILPKALEHGWSIISGELLVWLSHDSISTVTPLYLLITLLGKVT